MKWHRIKALLLNYYYFTINSGDRMFDIFFWPLLDIFIWGFMTTYIQGITDFNLINVVFGAIILWVFIWRSGQDIVVYLLESYWSRSIYHLFISPVRSSEMVVSLCLLGLLRSLIAFVILSILSFFLYAFNILVLNPGHFTLFVVILLLFGWALGLMVSSLVYIFGSRVQTLAWSSIWIIQPFSCVFYPLSALPGWAAKVAAILPTTYVFEGLRASLRGEPLDYGSLQYALIFVLVFLAVASLIMVWSIAIAKKRGTFAKPE